MWLQQQFFFLFQFHIWTEYIIWFLTELIAVSMQIGNVLFIYLFADFYFHSLLRRELTLALRFYPVKGNTSWDKEIQQVGNLIFIRKPICRFAFRVPLHFRIFIVLSNSLTLPGVKSLEPRKVCLTLKSLQVKNL